MIQRPEPERSFQFAGRNCPACGSSSARRLFDDINRREGLALTGSVVRCADCEMLYLSPAPTSADLAGAYRSAFIDPVVAETATSARRPLDASLARRALHGLNGVLRGHPHDWPDEAGRGRTILDFGCHDGRKLEYWRARGWNVAGIDLNEDGIAVARRLFPEGRFWAGDLLDLDIAERFDAIRADNVIEHLLDPGAYIGHLARLLKPGGQLRLFVPHAGALSVRLFGKFSAVFWMPFHLNLFTRASLSRLLARAGLEDIRHTAFTPIGSWTWTQRQLVLKPGFNRRPRPVFDRLVSRLSLVNYPGECISQWIGMGEELIVTGTKPT